MLSDVAVCVRACVCSNTPVGVGELVLLLETTEGRDFPALRKTRPY